MLLANGLAISALNLCGEYSEPYLALEAGVVAGLPVGRCRPGAARHRLHDPPPPPAGIADDGLVTLHGGPTASRCRGWPSARPTPPAASGRSTLLAAAVATFLFGIAAPLATLLGLSRMTETHSTRRYLPFLHYNYNSYN